MRSCRGSTDVETNHAKDDAHRENCPPLNKDRSSVCAGQLIIPGKEWETL